MEEILATDERAMARRKLCLEIMAAQRKYDRASVEIKNIKRILRETKHRYKRAELQDDERIRNNIRIRIMVIKGMMYVYHEYACLKGEEILEKRMQLCSFSSNGDDL